MEYWNCVSLLVTGGFTLIDVADYDKASRFNWWMSPTGYIEKGKSKVCKIATLHKLLMSPQKGMFCDHINGCRSDNRRSNLRVVTPQENAINRGKNLTSLSKYKGVAYDKRFNGRWFARITKNSKTYHIGMFDTELEAARAYNAVAPSFHGAFVRLNDLPCN